MLDAYCSGRLDAKCSTTHYRLRAVIYINILGPRIAFVFVCRRNVSVHTSACSDISSYLGLCCVLSSKCSQCAHTCVQWYLIIFGPALCVTPRSSDVALLLLRKKECYNATVVYAHTHARCFQAW